MLVKRMPTRSVESANLRVRDRALTPLFSTAAKELSDALDEPTASDILTRLAVLPVPMLAEYFSIYLMRDASLEPAAVAFLSSGKVVVKTERAWGDAVHVDKAAAEAWGKGETILREVSGADIDSAERPSGKRVRKSGKASASLLAVPMVIRDRRVGATVFARFVDRPFDANAVALAEGMSLCSAVALDNLGLWPRTRANTDPRVDVLAVVCHDLRNPLNAIAMSADALGRLSQANDTATLRKPIDLIKIATEHMNGLVQDLLTVAMLESKRLMVEVGPTSCALLMSDALQLTEPLARSKSLRLEAHELDDVPDVSCDRSRVLQVFSNLIGNAIKFTPAGGNIRLRAELGERGFVRFVVSDNGPGIGSEQLSRLFDPRSLGRTRGGQGLGLGLFIAQGIVEAQGGTIWGESRPGEGASFYFTLPMAASSSAGRRVV
jgi:signal transduction histidine kinase